MYGHKALIIASGPSAKGIRARDLPANVTLVGVNGVVDWIDYLDYWFALDASYINQRRLLKRRLVSAHYVTCGPIWARRGDTHYTRIDSLNTRGPEPEPNGSAAWWFWRYGCVAGINKESGHINTGNSAWGALGLVYHLGARDVALIGVDADDGPRTCGGQSGPLDHLPMLFNSALDGTFNRLVNCGHMQSEVPTMSLKEWLAC